MLRQNEELKPFYSFKLNVTCFIFVLEIVMFETKSLKSFLCTDT